VSVSYDVLSISHDTIISRPELPGVWPVGRSLSVAARGTIGPGVQRHAANLSLRTDAQRAQCIDSVFIAHCARSQSPRGLFGRPSAEESPGASSALSREQRLAIETKAATARCPKKRSDESPAIT
jgi:hypothetical protein